LEGGPDDTVLYGDKRVPRTNFISWDEAREMQASGLVEFASHSYDLHHGVLANPQGNLVPAAMTWRYDPRTRRYEDDAQYRERIRADLTRSRSLMEENLGQRAGRSIAGGTGGGVRADGPVDQELGRAN
jgi:biofilm PGA synthesis lipoprotein PgaB